MDEDQGPGGDGCGHPGGGGELLVLTLELQQLLRAHLVQTRQCEAGWLSELSTNLRAWFSLYPFKAAIY